MIVALLAGVAELVQIGTRGLRLFPEDLLSAPRSESVVLECSLLYDSVSANHFLVPSRTELRDPFLSREIDVNNAEALAIAISPFKIVHQAPEKVPL